jgi:hypothetical protein
MFVILPHKFSEIVVIFAVTPTYHQYIYKWINAQNEFGEKGR